MRDEVRQQRSHWFVLPWLEESRNDNFIHECLRRTDDTNQAPPLVIHCWTSRASERYCSAVVVKVIASDFSLPELFAVKNSSKVHARQKTIVLWHSSPTSMADKSSKGSPQRNVMARSSATTKAAHRRAVALLVLLSSTARGEDSHSCNLYLVNYMNSTLSLSLYDGRPDSCSSEPGFFYEVKPPVDGKAGTLLASGRGIGRGINSR
jgi:hypothetical protein